MQTKLEFHSSLKFINPINKAAVVGTANLPCKADDAPASLSRPAACARSRLTLGAGGSPAAVDRYSPNPWTIPGHPPFKRVCYITRNNTNLSEIVSILPCRAW
ncbi:hypothetical protein GWI33_002433 [Rhynchophorus ferrugineus]|uniref:Uncharacterized protein n=1 Tax=Rhynchophorus ferrugineus TaxID=354439 RepID=A0A834ML03_RHYFE|nr:hypothetical protein GWI33_002433 [Rhynchophorus ferrugineus]